MKFPLIEHLTMEVAKRYGMIQPGESSTKAVRAVFVNDPKLAIRAIIFCPPVDWRPGDDVIVPTSGSCGAAKERTESKDSMTCYDWYFCTKKIDKEKVLSRILKK